MRDIRLLGIIALAFLPVFTFIAIAAARRLKTMKVTITAARAASHGGRERTRDNVRGFHESRSTTRRPIFETPSHSARFTSIGGGRVWRTRSQYLATPR